VIYLDHNATAPLLDEVREAMLPWLTGVAGNASSLHAAGRRAKVAIEDARGDVAALVGADPRGIHFCSGGTEADAWALRALAQLAAPDRRVILHSAVEHPAVRASVRAAVGRGAVARAIPVDARGCLCDFAVDDDVGVVAVMAANNEIGNLYDVAAVAAKARKAGAFVHSDAVQAAGKVAVDVEDWDVDTAAFSAHKLGGPQGIGALYVRPGLALPALIPGGGQEAGLRSGTENVAGIVGFGAAARLARKRLAATADRLSGLRDAMAEHILRGLPGSVELGDIAGRLPNTLSMAIPDVAGEALLFRLDAVGIAVSTGSACSSGSGEPSPVLVAMGLPAWQIKGALRLTLGPSTTSDAALRAAREVVAAGRALQQLSEGLHVHA